MLLSYVALLFVEPQSAVAQAPIEIVAPTVDPHQAWGLTVDAQMAKLDGTLLSESWDVDALLERILRGAVVDKQTRAFFAGTFSGEFEFSKGIVRTVQQFDGSYSFLRLLPSGRALFRMESDQGLNYHELVLVSEAGKGIRVVDVFVHASGELISETFGRMLSPSLRPAGEELSAEEAELRERHGDIAQFNVLARSDAPAALKVFAEFPEHIRARHELQLAHVFASSLIDEETSRAALAEFEKLHPASPALHLLQMERALEKRDAQECRRILGVLDAALDDGFLDLVRARAYGFEQNYSKASELLVNALERDQRLHYQTSWAGLDIALVTKDHERLIGLLLTLEADYGIQWGKDLVGVPRFESFTQSEQYQRWLQRAPQPAAK